MKKYTKLIAASLVLACCIKFSVFVAPAPTTLPDGTTTTVESTEDPNVDIVPLEDDPFAEGGI